MKDPRARFNLVAMDAGARLQAFARDVRTGLTSRPKHLHCCYFYDAEGSLLFEEICDLPEYYLPRAEGVILQQHADEIVGRLPSPVTLIELGSGNAAKTRRLIDALLRRQPELCYVPVDICRAMLEESSRALLKEYPNLEVLAVAGEYHDGLRHLRGQVNHPKLILWLGSNVGNFHRPEAAEFLAKVRETMSIDDRLLVGIDLRKERRILEKAYDDSRGVTAQFNLNLLGRINRELDGRFDLDQFRHRAVYDEKAGRIEMCLDSTTRQQVAIGRLELVVSFEAGEPIHTENSYKYSPAEIEELACGAGLRLERQWFDPERRFSENLFAIVE